MTDDQLDYSPIIRGIQWFYFVLKNILIVSYYFTYIVVPSPLVSVFHLIPIGSAMNSLNVVESQ